MKRLSIDKNTIKYTFSILLITLGLIMMLAVFGLTSPLFFKSTFLQELLCYTKKESV